MDSLADPGFGVVIAACDADLHLAAAACASIRWFMDDVPICLLMDGRRSTRALARTYGVQVIRLGDVAEPELRELGFGWGLTKLNALWVSPFETFLFLDADTIVWGDPRLLVDLARADVVVDDPGRSGTPESFVSRWYMDVEGVGRHFPSFACLAHLDHFVNAGVFFARRGVIPLERYLELRRFHKSHRGVFAGGDQGLFNFLVFDSADRGLIRLARRPLQALVLGPRELLRFPVVEDRPQVVGEPRVLHWSGPRKLWLHVHRDARSAPSVFFRREYEQARTRGRPRVLPLPARLRLDDLRFFLRYGRRRLRIRLRRRARRLIYSLGSGPTTKDNT